MYRQKIFQSDSFSYSDFPEQSIIQSIRVAVLDTTVTKVYVSAVFSQPGQFTLQLSSDIGHLLTFSYSGSLWLKSRSDLAFGFLKLKQAPFEFFKYLDKEWKLNKNCYTTPIRRTGLHTLCVQGMNLPQSQVLQLRTGGEIQVQHTTTSNSTIINIGRSMQYTQGYYQPPKSTQYYIRTVNGSSVQELNIYSSDSTILIKGPFSLSESIYVLYIKTLKGFPVCSQWSDSF